MDDILDLPDAPDAAPVAEKEVRIKQNGMTLPRPGSKCGMAWDVFNEISTAKQAPATVVESMSLAVSRGLVEGNVRAEYNSWRKFYGIPAQGRVADPAKADEKAVKDAEKAAAKAVKDAEKDAAKAAKDAVKAAAKAVKDAEKAAAKAAKEAAAAAIAAAIDAAAAEAAAAAAAAAADGTEQE